MCLTIIWCWSQDNHRCVENSMRGNCPICFEFLFGTLTTDRVPPLSSHRGDVVRKTARYLPAPLNRTCLPRADSIQPTSVLRCGHTLHEHCFQEMQQNNQTSCPVCMKSFANMQPVRSCLVYSFERFSAVLTPRLC